MRLWVRPVVRTNRSPGFSRTVGSAPDTSRLKVLCLPCGPLSGRTDSRASRQLRRKENSSRGSRQRLRVRSRRRPPSTLRLGNVNPIPFRRSGRRKRPRSAELSCPLGSAHPCPTAVHMEPFSTSVFKVLTWIFATATKICTTVGFTQAHASSCVAHCAPSYSPDASRSRRRQRLGGPLERHPFSGLVPSAGELLHTP